MDPFASTRKLIALLRERGLKPSVAVLPGAHPTRAVAVAQLVAERAGLSAKAARRVVERREPLSLGFELEDALNFALELQRAGGSAELQHERSELYALPAAGPDPASASCAWLLVVGRSVYAAQGRAWDWGGMRELVKQGHSQAIMAAIDELRAGWAEAGLREADTELELLRGVSPVDAALEATLAAAPPAELDAAAAVYADWLQAQGDPRGAVGIAALQGDVAVHAELHARHATHLLGPFGRGLAPDSLRWCGPVVIAARPRFVDAQARAFAAVETLLGLPACASLRELELHHEGVAMDGVGPALAGAACRASLRRLSLAGPADLELRGAYPRLEFLHVELAMRRFGFGEFVAPALRELRVELVGPRRPLADSFAGLTAPALEQLVLSLSHIDDFELATGSLVEQLGHALARRSFAGLRRLTLLADASSPFESELPRMLAGLPCMATLEQLDLRGLRLSRGARRQFELMRSQFPALSLSRG